MSGLTFDDADAADRGHLAKLFGLLADPMRVRILLLLREGQRNVSSLCHELGHPQRTVSHHLGLLKMGHLLVSQRAGKQVFYRLTEQPGADALVRLTVARRSIRLSAK